MQNIVSIHKGDYDNEYPRIKDRIPGMRSQDIFLHEKIKSPPIIEMILKNNSSKIENTIILNQTILLDSFKNYFEPTFEPIPRYKKKEWIYNDENNIPYFPYPDTKKSKRKSKYNEGDHSVQTANLGRFMDMAIAMISQIWEREIQAAFGTKYYPPNLEVFDGIVASIRGKNGKIATILSPIFHLGSTDTIHMSRDILEMIDFYTTPESAIGLTLAIAHEFGHSIQRQLGLIQDHGQAEDMADFVAGYTMKVLGSMGLLGESDVVTALRFFESIGVPEDQRDGLKVHDTPEGRMSHLMRGYMCDIQGLRKEITQYYPILKLNSKVLKILDYN
ncbi:hypothetical protein HOO68_02345 [Candidatus Gracilibacteria bacterium]|nr:hypothetical protein [Candidatus Gracilibacteria bacterium]